MVEYVNYSEPIGPKLYKIGRFSFSTIEVKHLLGALAMITLALMVAGRDLLQSIGIISFVTLYLITIGLGFLLHELGHKFVAQHYGFISEFRADFMMMFVAILIAFTGFIFLAPGAVLILGRPSRRQNGIISVAGPLVNLTLAALFFIASLIITVSPNSLLALVFSLGIGINAWLGIFNMLPFWVLDGKKVLAWNKPIYFSVLAGLIFFLFFSGLLV